MQIFSAALLVAVSEGAGGVGTGPEVGEGLSHCRGSGITGWIDFWV